MPVQKMNLNFKDREEKQAVRAKLEAMPEVLVTSSLPWNLELTRRASQREAGCGISVSIWELKRRRRWHLETAKMTGPCWRQQESA